jgi:hypothetical protein
MDGRVVSCQESPRAQTRIRLFDVVALLFRIRELSVFFWTLAERGHGSTLGL